MKFEELVVGKTYWCIITSEPVIVVSNVPDSTFGLVYISYHPSTGKVSEKGTRPMVFPDQLRELSPLEMELL